MIKRRNFIWMIPLFCMISYPLWSPPITSFLTPRKDSAPPPSQVNQQGQQFNLEKLKILQNKNGQTTAEIEAEAAFTTDTPNQYILHQVNANLYGGTGSLTNVTATRGIFDGNLKKLTLSEQVVIAKEEKKQRLFTDLFYYDDNSRQINCPGKTRLEGENIQINGSSLTYDIEQGIYQMGGRVVCLIDAVLEQ